jgi:hypothetical protein
MKDETPIMRCPWWKAHDFVSCGAETVIYPLRGPFDPRTEAQRTNTVDMEICSQCGFKHEMVFDLGW